MIYTVALKKYFGFAVIGQTQSRLTLKQFRTPSIKSKPESYKVQTIRFWTHAVLLSASPKTLSDLRSLCDFDLIESVRSCFSVRVP